MWRDEMRTQRERMPQEVFQQKGQAIFGRVIALSDYPRIRHIACYVSSGREVDTHAFICRAIADGKQVAVPVVRSKGQMDFQWIASLEDLKPARFGLLAPLPDVAKIALPDAFEWVITPGLAFDRCGHRVGMGQGYYDRFLARTRAVRIGLAYAFQVVNALSAEWHDIPMDLIVTEREVIRCQMER